MINHGDPLSLYAVAIVALFAVICNLLQLSSICPQLDYLSKQTHPYTVINNNNCNHEMLHQERGQCRATAFETNMNG